MTVVPVVRHVLAINDEAAQRNRERLDAARIFGINLMASPGAGKTSLILVTAARLVTQRVRPGVIEGDLATRIDADKVAAAGLPVTQINTGGGCHLDAAMIDAGLDDLPLDRMDVLFVENVGNLVCPANFQLGTHANAVVASVPEGHDKPCKYPGIYAGADVVILNKIDLAPLLDFDLSAFVAGVRLVNQTAPILPLSSRTGEGLDGWVEWIAGERETLRDE
jgi:hydrogenase nickel incorporation protein HypB